MNRRQRGEFRLNSVFWLLVFSLVVLICWKAIPVKIRTAEFLDYMEDQAKFAGGTPPEALKKELLRKAKELELPVTEKNLLVVREGDHIRLECSFSMPLEFPFYTYTWRFKEKVVRPIFSV
jgi:hypothetical protein